MTPVKLPQLSLAMEEGKILNWLVADGERVAAGQPIVEVETDKAMTEVEAPAAGTIHRRVAEGAVVPLETVLAEIDDGGAASSKQTAVAAAEVRGSASAIAPRPATDSKFGNSTVAIDAATAKRKHRASPAARRIARERGIDLSTLDRSGPDDRVTASDLLDVAATAKPSLRESVVAQLAASWRDIPHIHVGGELDGSGLAAAKRAAVPNVTATDLLILAMVRALREVPELNGVLGKPSPRIHLALAVATPNGVIAPVIRNAHELSLAPIASERARLVAAARAGHSDRRDLAGGTITLTNLGAYPVDFFSPIVSGPQIAMVATGRLAERSVVIDGSIAVRHRIWVNVAIDHRGADGVSGARLLAALERCMNELAINQ